MKVRIFAAYKPTTGKMKEKLLLIAFGLMLTLGMQAQKMKGRIYYNGNMSVSHLLRDKTDESPEDRAQRERVMDEIYTMSVTVEFPTSVKMTVKMKITEDKERAKELGVQLVNRKLWMADLTLAAKRKNYWSKYTAEGNVITIEDGTKYNLSEDGEQLFIDDLDMKATLKRIK